MWRYHQCVNSVLLRRISTNFNFIWRALCGLFSHRINTCHNSCCKTSIHCQAIKKKLASSENEKNWHRPIEAAKNVICLGRFGELSWRGLQLYCTCHHRQVDKQHSFSLYWMSLRNWLQWVFHNCNCLFDSDHWSKSERLSKKCRKKLSESENVFH